MIHNSSVEEQRSVYQAELESSIGVRFREIDPDNGRSLGLVASLTRPIALMMLALITFALVFTVLLWRDGKFNGLWKKIAANSGMVTKPKIDKWLLGGNQSQSANTDQADAETLNVPSGNVYDDMALAAQADESAVRAAAALANIDDDTVAP